MTETDEVATTNIILGLDEGKVGQALDETRNKALRKGHTVVNSDGSRVWRTRSIIYGADHREIFHPDGERVRCQWAEITMTEGGETVRNLRCVWVNWDAALEGA